MLPESVLERSFVKGLNSELIEKSIYSKYTTEIEMI